ncbi:RNA-binding transcriptional accessory protein, partial [Escherichia coli]|nr:RNA-binding transcriptional accessory protein [Escherichia coli]
IRKRLRQLFQRQAKITSKITKKAKENEDEAQKYQQYFDWSEVLLKAPSHRLLALLRAENEGFIKLKIEIDNDEAIGF